MAPYLTPEDFWSETEPHPWFTRGLTLDDVAEESELAAAIEAFSQRFDYLTNDHFAPEPAEEDSETEITVTVPAGQNSRVYVPKRIRELTMVETQDSDGDWAEDDLDDLEVVSSVDGDTVNVRVLDYVRFRPLTASLATTLWTTENAHRFTGTFGWPDTPDRVKRAVARMVWDHFTAANPETDMAERVTTADITYDRATTKPTGLPEVDEAIEEFRRPRIPVV